MLLRQSYASGRTAIGKSLNGYWITSICNGDVFRAPILFEQNGEGREKFAGSKGTEEFQARHERGHDRVAFALRPDGTSVRLERSREDSLSNAPLSSLSFVAGRLAASRPGHSLVDWSITGRTAASHYPRIFIGPRHFVQPFIIFT